MLDSLLDHLKAKEFEIRENYSLRSEAYIRIDTVARLAVYPEDSKKLVELLKILIERNIPYRVLGRMSNVLFKNPVYEGVIVKTDLMNNVGISDTVLTLDCGCFFPSVMKRIARANLGGFEGLWGIPGSVGGMVKQNAGAFGYQISDRFVDCLAYDTLSREVVSLSAADMSFSYRTSALCDTGLVLLSARFEAQESVEGDILSMASSFSEKRRSTQPIGEPSLGSVFKKHGGVGAGYLIDKIGLKGVRFGGAMVSTKHAGFIVNTGNATSEDVIALIDYVKEKVLLELGIALEEEIEII